MLWCHIYDFGLEKQVRQSLKGFKPRVSREDLEFDLMRLDLENGERSKFTTSKPDFNMINRKIHIKLE